MTGPQARFTDRVSASEVDKLPEEYRELIIRLLTIQADCEIGIPGVYGRPWILAAPTADDCYRLAHIVAEEIDHFQQINGLLRALGHDRTDLVHRSGHDRYLRVFGARDAHSWADVASFCCLIDRVGRFQLEELVDSSYQPLDDVLPRILEEEALHVRFGTARLAQLAAQNETRDAAQAAVDRWYPRALECFDQEDSRWAEKYVEWGLNQRLNHEVRQAYEAEVTTVLTRMGLTIPPGLNTPS